MDINCGGVFPALTLFMAVVDDARNSGASLSDLRWRVSSAQRSNLLSTMYMVGPVDVKQWETGAVFDLVQFCGISVLVDETVPKDTVILERAMQWVTASTMKYIPVPQAYSVQ